MRLPSSQLRLKGSGKLHDALNLPCCFSLQLLDGFPDLDICPISQIVEQGANRSSPACLNIDMNGHTSVIN